MRRWSAGGTPAIGSSSSSSRRLGDERAGDLQQLGIAEAQVAGALAGARSARPSSASFSRARASAPRSSAPRQAEQPGRPSRRSSARGAPIMTFSSTRHVAEDLQVLERAREAERGALDAARSAGDVDGRRAARRPALRGRDAGDGIEQRGLAGAVRADHALDAASRDSERQRRRPPAGRRTHDRDRAPQQRASPSRRLRARRRRAGAAQAANRAGHAARQEQQHHDHARAPNTNSSVSWKLRSSSGTAVKISAPNTGPQ